MELTEIYWEEDMFPKRISCWVERPYGILFYNEDNKDSYDSNHALIFREKVADLEQTLADILAFYSEKGIKPSIYQAISDDGYFEEIRDVLARHGFESWTEEQKYMVLSAENSIKPNPEIIVKRVKQWDDDFAVHIFEAAGEPWKIEVSKQVIGRKDALFFVAYHEGKPVGMSNSHMAESVCRVDYLLVSKGARNIGVGRALIHSFVEYCKAQKIENCYLWPDGDTAERIYHEAGFRLVETKQAGRASFDGALEVRYVKG